MVQYSNLTYNDAWAEIMMRLGRNRNQINIDYETGMRYVDWAIREALTKTLPYKDWAYVNSIPVVHRQPLPADYVGTIRVLLTADGAPPYNEARKVAPKEYFELTSWRYAHHWNRGFRSAPIYMIWATNVISLAVMSPIVIYLYPNLDRIQGQQLEPYVNPTATVSGVWEYYQAPRPIAFGTDVLRIPYEFEDLVIITAVDKFLRNVQGADIRMSYQRIAEETQRIVALFQEKRKTDKRKLDNFVEPVVPEYPPQPEEGEVPNNLIGGRNGQ